MKVLFLMIGPPAAAELIALAEWFVQPGLVRKEVARVELAVAQKLEHRTVQLIGARANYRIY